ncbi:hypothetical protein A2U01_0116701, partial [Trifolium medium]|nr:hypothetical protein [Trifolium medium]
SSSYQLLQEDCVVPETRRRVVLEAYVLSRSGKVCEGARGCIRYVCVTESGREG